MKKETIEEAAGIYSGSILGFKHVTSVMEKHKAFVDGAEWRIEKAWHDVTEEPEKNKGTILLEDDKGIYYGYEINNCVIDNWKRMTDELKVVRWAYIKDLIPEQ